MLLCLSACLPLHLTLPSQDQAIQRLLGDIKELRSEGAVSEAMHASGESDVNQVRLCLCLRLRLRGPR